MTVLVFDIETIPDFESAKKLYNLENLSDEGVKKAVLALRRAKTGNEFLPLHLQKIIAISLVLHTDSQFKVWSLGDIHSDEKELITRFFSGIDRHIPTIVSWNGCGFDLPVLHYRALLHGVSAPVYWDSGDNNQAFRWNNYLSRFHARHLDLMDVLAGYQQKAFASLNDIASMLGFPGKMGMEGSKVYDAYLNGQIEAIRNYCETDVLNTWCVYIRYELMRGKYDAKQVEDLLQSMKSSLMKENKPHLLEFCQNLANPTD